MSVPDPIAIPILAAFNAGASFTPSPVTATNSPWRLSEFTIFNFCNGVTRANTSLLDTKSSNSFSPRRKYFSTSSPCVTCSEFSTSERSRAIESAVSGWSPVIMRTLIPAVQHSRIEATASLRIGSMKATKPMNFRFLISLSVYFSFLATFAEAKAITR